MGKSKLTFERYETKYLLSRAKYEALRQRLDPYIEPDEFPHSTVCSLYYDGDDYHLIRHSIDKPVYKEKLRVRSYHVPAADEPVFVELKKKFKGVVYKRRVEMSEAQATEYLAGRSAAPFDGQTIREIDWFLKENLPTPKVFIACDRNAYRAIENPELRITFDEDLRWRDTDLRLTAGDGGLPMLSDAQVLMEIKIPGAAPLWLAHMLSELGIFPGSFSKYGVCYTQNILEKYINGVLFDA